MLNSPTILPNNQIVKAVRSGLVRAEQAYQCVGIGYLTRDDSFIFRYPIMTLDGSRVLTRFMMPSLKHNRPPRLWALQKILCKTLSISLVDCKSFWWLWRICIVNCGSTHYYKWKVRPGTEGTSTESPRKPDLDLIRSKFYLDEETNTLKAIKKTDTHLIGKTIKLRSPISGCNHTNHYGICEVCYGQLSDNIPPNTNLGQANGTMVCEKSSQGVMSVKHYDGSSKVEPIIIAQES